jgi:N-acetylated-alpha-linked acidic dipeptidase
MIAEATIKSLCDAVDAAAMMRHLEEFARRVKLSGTAAERESFDYLKSCLDGYGLRTELILHDAYISLPGPARLDIGSASPDCITHSFSRSSGKPGVRGSVVYAGAGTPSDFAKIDAKGRIVLLENIANPAATLRASQAGAIGQIHISPHRHLHEMCISAVWGSPTKEQVDTLPQTVVLSVRKEDGDALKRRVQAGENVDAMLYSEVDTGWRKTPILQADLDPGAADADDAFVMFSGHHDTWHLGVMDNGGANTTMLEVARLFAPHRNAMRRGLRLCFWSGHSHGRYSGSAWYADNKWEELAKRCAAHVNVDSTGAKGNTVLSDALSSAELFPLAAEAVKAEGGQELDGHRMSRAGDQSFWGIGIPSMFMGMGEQPLGGENPMGAVLGGANRKSAGFGWWWHTPDDTIDKMDPDLLVRDTSVYVHALWRLVTDRVLPLDYGRQAETLGRELKELQDRGDGRIDLTPLLDRVETLRQRTADLKEGGGDGGTVNRALMRVSRALVPIDYTSGDRFDHDPALTQSVASRPRRRARTSSVSPSSRHAGR